MYDLEVCWTYKTLSPRKVERIWVCDEILFGLILRKLSGLGWKDQANFLLQPCLHHGSLVLQIDRWAGRKADMKPSLKQKRVDCLSRRKMVHISK